MSRLLRVPAIAVLLLVFNGLPWSGRAEDARSGQRPTLFYAPLATQLRLGSADVLGIAHNAGDRAPSAQVAMAHGADVIEIDVRNIGGRLHAAHASPPGWMPSMVYNGPTLGEAWKSTDGVGYVQIDLKDTSVGTVNRIAAFLDRHATERRVLVSTSNFAALEVLHERAEDVGLILSIGNPRQLQALQKNPERASLLTGVSVRAELLDRDAMAWFKDRGLLVIAWTVNDVAQLNDLVALGIDGVSTDNLAILDAIHWAEQRRDAVNLGRLFQ